MMTPLATRAGWSHEQIRAILAGDLADDERLAALLAIVREATATTGHVHEMTWKSALEAGWSGQQLAEERVADRAAGAAGRRMPGGRARKKELAPAERLAARLGT